MTNAAGTGTLAQLITWGVRDAPPQAPLRAFGGVAACGPSAGADYRIGGGNALSQFPLFEGQHAAEGLYDPRHEHDACGVGFVVDIQGRKSQASCVRLCRC